jgi:hypothetical protein
VPGEGFEPPTFGLQNRCTTTVLTRRRGEFYHGTACVTARSHITEILGRNTRSIRSRPPPRCGRACSVSVRAGHRHGDGHIAGNCLERGSGSGSPGEGRGDVPRCADKCVEAGVAERWHAWTECFGPGQSDIAALAGLPHRVGVDEVPRDGT